MADRSQPIATKSVRSWGFNTYKPIDAFNALKAGKPYLRLPDNPGKPDMLAWYGGRIAPIEVKDGQLSFAFKDFEDNKREWAEECRERFYTEFWLWLCIGEDPPNYSIERYNPRLAWLIPYPAFIEAEARLEPFQASIPYRAKPGMRREIQEQSLDAITLFAPFELWWQDGNFNITPRHPFYQMYMMPEPVPLFQEAINRWPLN